MVQSPSITRLTLLNLAQLIDKSNVSASEDVKDKEEDAGAAKTAAVLPSYAAVAKTPPSPPQTRPMKRGKKIFTHYTQDSSS